ncbi:MAG: hypothetical protein HRT94_02565 [Alphaproteobacteria bacterium]|nr:hypothetical protein [Alphaproteobacteria bacterium]
MGDVKEQEASAEVMMTSDMAVEQSRAGFSILDRIVKNPYQEIHIYDVEANLGTQDDRRPVMMDEDAYESVVSLNGDCTATIVTVDGYDLVGEGTLAVTAAHCVEGYADDDLTAYGSFVNGQGNVEHFQMQSADVWIHPFRGDFNRSSDPSIVHTPSDIAFIYFDEETPPLVTPAEFITIDLDDRALELLDEIENSGLTLEELHEKYEDAIEGLSLTSAGFSNDVVGLHTHEGIEIEGISGSQTIVTNADDAQGASGGPNYYQDDDGSIAMNEEGQPHVFAVNSAGDTQTATNPNPENSYITILKPEFLETVPFLEEEEPFCEAESGTINNPHGVNIRYGDGEVFQTLVRDQDGPSAIPWGSQIDIHAVNENYLGEEWALVSGPNGRMGYVHGDFIDYDPVQCDTKTSLAAPTP